MSSPWMQEIDKTTEVVRYLLGPCHFRRRTGLRCGRFLGRLSLHQILLILVHVLFEVFRLFLSIGTIIINALLSIRDVLVVLILNLFIKPASFVFIGGLG